MLIFKVYSALSLLADLVGLSGLADLHRLVGLTVIFKTTVMFKPV